MTWLCLLRDYINAAPAAVPKRVSPINQLDFQMFAPKRRAQGRLCLAKASQREEQPHVRHTPSMSERLL
jgi:hypothetical protein